MVYLNFFGRKVKAKDVVNRGGQSLEAFQYSTSEQWTGEYWIDGRKIYSKTIAYSGSTSGKLNVNIYTGLKCSSINRIFLDSQNTTFTMCNAGADSNSTSINVGAVSSSGWYGVYIYLCKANNDTDWVLNLQTNANTTVPKGWFTVRYTYN